MIYKVVTNAFATVFVGEKEREKERQTERERDRGLDMSVL